MFMKTEKKSQNLETAESVTARIKSLEIDGLFTRPIKTVDSTRTIVQRLKDDPTFKDRAYSVIRDRPSGNCVIIRKS